MGAKEWAADFKIACEKYQGAYASYKRVGFVAGMEHERQRSAKLVEFLESIAPSWLPEGIRDERRKLLKEYRGEG